VGSPVQIVFVISFVMTHGQQIKTMLGAYHISCEVCAFRG